ncbi:bifunctional UDP-N-acetylglucosamine diphosphorylase/glucosamine-1-phosphate N-acetyltransferase GlmU [Dactylosporangium aurantiacum]|uniref:Bifunctional protein GlmU n=1 Tax=Dactylosporangium aurantiacum TaxID=35754 RepID=A0A9Q9ISX2_9ACTN|nr:bifunctional UDP-N-acetylglucosamine diphosphorylase/glucosamine-1-phosphate N-acetyltransferase GlmU [Dactylosporangium aurantiacum]MDG6109411.1 bifunctional UDP-N-acetylglucosamine diphosphorylase/glucosamine-1-phosphate N-acetyltransferase GlmU [Dactylosporangium aurantiacum]UWZ59345.1 bifunctional UDP-N-acetylglucosamine diphosphorylase/glucosamine-1-phosphate N-acetyltransferase GlmU [Dactylosporangium aurantiacum]
MILAAGEGKRMKSALPKVLHPLLGRTLVGHVLAAAQEAVGGAVTVVVGHGGELVRAHLEQVAPEAVPVTQIERRGTGHAVRIALDETPGLAAGLTGTVVVLNGDIPLLRAETLSALIHTHESTKAAATVLTAEVADPTGLGRIVRNRGGEFAAIVEERDATPAQRAIREINSGAYVFDAERLREMLGKLSTDNDQGEEYLTDVIGLLAAAGAPIVAHRAPDATETLGANDRAELAGLRAIMRDRINDEWMRDGVAIIDPATTWIDVTVTLGRDAVVEPNTHLRGATRVGEGAVVGPDTTLVDVVVGDGATVVRTHALSSEIGPQASVGPFAYLRPGTRLGRKSKIGTFVETKAATVGDGAKVPHLSYVGDAEIGEGTNIGAATVFVNYDGVQKRRSVIGAHARTGADNMFVAPVHVGDGAYTAAGSVITKDVPPGALGVSRAPQRNIEGWVERKRPGTAAAQAARDAHTREENHVTPASVADVGPRDEQ